MIIETNEYKLLAIVGAHIAAAVFIGLVVGAAFGTPHVIVTAALISSAATGALHVSRLLRRELRTAYIALAEAVTIVHKSRGLCLTPSQFAQHLEACVHERLAGSPLRFISVRFMATHSTAAAARPASK